MSKKNFFSKINTCQKLNNLATFGTKKSVFKFLKINFLKKENQFLKKVLNVNFRNFFYLRYGIVSCN
jgi:hypothetical protein